MSILLFKDAQLRPTLFRWNGPVDSRELLRWLQSHGWSIPHDLIEFWATTGGGKIFETETLFKPLVPSAAEEGVEFATDWHIHRGMPLGLVVFHEGLEVSAVRCTDGMYLTLGADAQIARQFRSFEEWYTSALRNEYHERYGLPRVV